MKLSELNRGESAKIIKIGRIGELKKRLVDMGVTAGEIIKLERNAPLGDPQEFIIKSTGIAIRKEDANHIEVEKFTK
ncbi:MAG: ferrous iron transport protein A [Cetobacterium sp.]|uniref:Ferrous iron transport protein A n=1 Tax=Cetobacterium ceti TaxID=180163 RepID=A0A1T4JV55_9FUSO|nr:FeoA family protein [Cetobacterium ceti]MCJ8343025.1 ferrous iron transport protein A [Cetobacterium sp.]SJZ33975.1 ferrous iron transport protein A [Cetobacterium ceti]